MAKYRKKPVVIEAFQFDGDLMNKDGKFYVPEWAAEAWINGTMYFDGPELYIKTLEGIHHASVNDYIIQGVNGELYPCKPDIFEKTYDSYDTFEERPRSVNIDFGAALKFLRCGSMVCRKGWNGKGMFIYMVPPGRYTARTVPAKMIAGEDGKVDYGAYLALKTVQGNVVPWLASQADVLANDWMVLPTPSVDYKFQEGDE